MYGLLSHFKYGLNDTIFSGYVSGVGSFLGGLVGAIVAFGIARYQLKADRKIKSYQNKIKYYNILKVLLSELQHNKEIISLCCKEEKEYTQLLEFEVWNKIKFDVSNFLDTEDFDIINELYRDFKDIKLKIIREYKEKPIDYNIRKDSLNIVIKKVENLLKILSNDLPNNK